MSNELVFMYMPYTLNLLSDTTCTILEGVGVRGGEGYRTGEGVGPP